MLRGRGHTRRRAMRINERAQTHLLRGLLPTADANMVKFSSTHGLSSTCCSHTPSRLLTTNAAMHAYLVRQHPASPIIGAIKPLRCLERHSLVETIAGGRGGGAGLDAAARALRQQLHEDTNNKHTHTKQMQMQTHTRARNTPHLP